MGGFRPMAGYCRASVILLLGCAALFLTGCHDAREPRDAQARRGAALFAQHCAACHGPAAVGQDPTNPFGSADPQAGFVAPALNGRGHCFDHTPAVLQQLIGQGSGVPGSPMHGFAHTLSEAEQIAVIAYLYELWPRPVRRAYRERHDAALRELWPRGR
jgi:mono/diheme cytochrome c family protein